MLLFFQLLLARTSTASSSWSLGWGSNPGLLHGRWNTYHWATSAFHNYLCCVVFCNVFWIITIILFYVIGQADFDQRPADRSEHSYKELRWTQCRSWLTVPAAFRSYCNSFRITFLLSFSSLLRGSAVRSVRGRLAVVLSSFHSPFFKPTVLTEMVRSLLWRFLLDWCWIQLPVRTFTMLM